MVQLALLLALAPLPARAATPRTPLAVAPVSLPPLPAEAPMAGYRLSIKLVDAARGRATAEGGVVSLAGLDLGPLEAVARAQGLRFQPRVRVDEQALAGLLARAEARSGRAQPDLLGMLEVTPRDASPAGLLAAGRALERLALVEYAHIRVVGTPPPGDIGSTTPDYTGYQDYFGPDPGIDAEYAWSVGATGANVRLSDCEYGWVDEHEDLVDRELNLEAGQTVPYWVASYEYDYHGTATIGQTSAVVNDYGTSGLVPDAEVHTYPEWSDEEGERRVSSITNAIADSLEGDVVMLEMQAVGRGGGYGPAELDPDVWTVVKAGTDAGVVVVGAAGNGAQNLDSSAYSDYMGWGDSGAIIVGAGSGDTDHDAAYFTTYGSRVNLQGWGDWTVFTLGYGTWAELDGDREQTYTEQFAGTSSATPIVTSAAIAVQDLVMMGGGAPLAPTVLRQLLVDTGVPQGTGGEIGPLPDLRAALEELDSDADGYADLGYGGADCDDEDATINPGAEEVPYDGEDQDCDSADEQDVDDDGYLAPEVGGDDCDDANAEVHPGAEETWYDGRDSDCSGGSDDDQDGDGHDVVGVGDDCDDENAAVFPGAAEAEQPDGVDSDCDGEDAPAGADSGGDSGEPDTGDADTGDIKVEPVGCACSSARGPSRIGAWLAGALGLVALRRRSARRDR